MSDALVFELQARRPVTIVVVLLVWAVLIVAWQVLDAAPWIVAALGAFTLPALWEFATGARAGLRLDARTLSWFTGARDAEVALAQIDHVRLDTRLDFSVRATLVLASGRKLRLPFEATPPHQAFETSLQAHGIAVKRFHFQLFQ